DRLGIQDGQEILLRSETGEWTGIAKRAAMKERHLQAYWPEANVLIPRRFDPVSGEPDYNTLVMVHPVAALGGTRPARVEAALAAAVACAPVAAGAGLAAPPAGEGARGATGAPAGGAALDFSSYQKLLDDYLQVTSKPGEPLETRFDYVRLRLSPGRAERLS